MTEAYGQKVDSSIITELIVGQMDKWYLDMTEVRYDESEKQIVVESLDSGHVLERVDVTYSLFSEDGSFSDVDIDFIAAKVNYATKKEMDRL